jgi:hypothetical protein
MLHARSCSQLQQSQRFHSVGAPIASPMPASPLDGFPGLYEPGFDAVARAIVVAYQR